MPRKSIPAGIASPTEGRGDDGSASDVPATVDRDAGGSVQLSDSAQEGEMSESETLEVAPERIDKRILQMISEEAAKRYQMAPFAKEEGVLKVAMVSPQDIKALNVLRFLAEKEKMEIQAVKVSEKAFENILAQYGGTETALKDAILSLHRDGDEDIRTDIEEVKTGDQGILQDAPIAKLVQVILGHALEGGASDIHIEPVENNYRVRFRVDGVLHASLLLPIEVGRAVISRIKILANLKIDEKRKPQDGRFRATQKDKTIDLRVSTLPVVEGEKVVMRVLDKSKGMTNLETLGLIARNNEILMRKIQEPYGIILLTGPTGSGKSTTLYGFLNILNQEERNIITLEDPVEYFLDGINQSQIKPEIGYTFANGLRSILRQDPNIIMVGEIRDNETAELAIHAALTGHLVLSTLHTNNAVGAIPRLIDMGIEPFLLSSSLQTVMAQRLVRRVCEHCKEAVGYSPAVMAKAREALQSVRDEELGKYGIDTKEELTFYEGKGCKECHDVGYKGRIAIYETLEVTEKMQTIIADKRGAQANVQEEAFSQGMTTLKQDGLLKALRGLTTLAEVERVTEGVILVDEE